jgi:hypothetical protein
MDFLKRPRITDGSALELDNGEKVEMTYEEFLRQVSNLTVIKRLLGKASREITWGKNCSYY